MRLAVAGATGRTGGEVVAEATDRSHDVLALSRDPGPDERDVANLPDLLAGDVDALVDFTVPAATAAHARTVADTGTPLVVGTTGLDDEALAALDEAAERAPVLSAPNFAKGVRALHRVVRAGVEALPEYDVEVTETHHAEKRDAPSGTATSVLDAIDEAREDALERVHGREGTHVRDPGEVGVHVRRAGTVRGEHEVVLAGDDEVLTLAHRAESRRVFAAGALDAAEWLVGRDPGSYDFGEVVA